ncbi:MAG: amidohydrolase family protein [Sulfolobales archaeon]|nr:amidohydrolase family protein [Sulfolobales archaeon]MDW8083412.1 amidohydrolase family protein [Sulfolobales archaeon]
MKKVCGKYTIVSAYEVVEDACVIFDEKIVRIEKERDIPEDTVVTHGFASIHTHLGLYPIRTTLNSYLKLDEWVLKYVWPWERLLRREPELSYASAILAISELVLSGVTAIADMHFNEDIVAEALLRVGVRGSLSIAIMSKGIYSSLDEALQDNLELARKLRGVDLLEVRLGPTTPRLLTLEEFKKVVDVATEIGVGIHTHIAEVPEDAIYLEREYGKKLKDFIEYVGLQKVNTIVAHGVWLDSDSLDVLAHPNITIAHCPSSNTLLRDGVAPIRSYLNRNIRVGLGVDVSPTYSMLDEIKTAIPLHLGRGDLGFKELFNAATSTGYRALGVGSGLIEVGETADVVLWSLNEPALDPVTDVVVFGRVSEVYVRGEKIVENGRLARVTSNEMKELRGDVTRHLKKCLTA